MIMNNIMKQVEEYANNNIFYIFHEYHGEKLINKIRRILRNRKYFKQIKKLKLSNLWYQCKNCDNHIEVYADMDEIAKRWGTCDHIGLCEKCILGKNYNVK
jgi:hypothetical protein